jgi:lipopolysaccharide export system protein LptA
MLFFLRPPQMLSRLAARQGLLLAVATLILGAGMPAHSQAAAGDRQQPMVVDADQPGTLDLQRQVVVFQGNVAVTQGTLSLRAQRIEVRESADGQRLALALGSAQKPATYRQKRDVTGDEWVEGQAERIEYDTRSDTLRFHGSASVRRLRGSTLADEISGADIVWDNAAGLFSVSGGTPTPLNPQGRIRAVLAPRAAAPSQPASAAASQPLTLQPSRSLGGDRP